MKSIITHLGALACAAALPLLVQGCGKSGAASNGNGADKSRTVNVRVEVVKAQPFVETLQLTGSVEAYDDVMVPAEEGGRVLEWTAQRGQRVRKGQVIARIDDALLRAAYEAANAGYLLAEVTYTKQKKVYDEQAISEWQLKSLEYQRDAAKAQADLARTRFEKASIKSPIDGVLDLRSVDAGEMVGPGMPIARVVNNDRLKVTAGVPERYAGSFRVGDAVSFTVDALPGETFSGKITVVGAAVSKDNRTLPIEVQVTNAGGKLKTDMIASMTITLAARPNSIVIDEDYMQQADRNAWIVFVDNGGVAEERPITIGATSRGKVLVSAGLREGDQLVTLGHQNVAGGQKLNVLN